MTMRTEDARYLEMRAEQEIRRAEAAKHPAATRAHAELAGHYLDRVYRASDASRSSK